jgi:hypothetical protein
VGIEDLTHTVADAKVGLVHVARNDENHRDRQVVVGHVRQPQGLRLGMESTQERQDRCAGTLGCTKDLTGGIRVGRICTPVTGEERCQTSRVRQGGHEVIPTNVLTTGFRNRHVNQMPGPSQRTHAEQTG